MSDTISQLHPDQWKPKPGQRQTRELLTQLVAALYARGIKATEETVQEHFGVRSAKIPHVRDAWYEATGNKPLGRRVPKVAINRVLKASRLVVRNKTKSNGVPSAEELDDDEVKTHPLTLAGSVAWFDGAAKRIGLEARP